MRASLTLLSIAALCGALFAGEEDKEKPLTVRFRLPKELAENYRMASLLSEKGRKRLVSLKRAESPANEDPWFTATFTEIPQRKNAVFGFPWMPGIATGITLRPIAADASEVTLEIPFTFYPANWQIPDALSKKLDLSSNAGCTYLTIRRVVEEKSFGTIYHPHFYVWGQLRKNIKDDAYDHPFPMPFVEPGVYEFGVVTGPSRGKEILRRRVRLEPGQGLELIGNQTVEEMIEAAKRSPFTRFDEADIVPRSVFHHDYNFDFDKEPGADEDSEPK
jgi:hypothetical protein